MRSTKHAVPALILAGVVMGSAACSSAADAPADPVSSAASAPTAAPTAGPSTGASMSSSAEAAPAEEAMITIVDFEYQIPESIAPGAEVTVTNEDDAPHTVTADGGGDFNVEVGPGETVTFTAPEETGDYAVICTYHPEMSGTLVIG